MTLPLKTNANAADNNNITSLTEDATIPWKVVNLDGDDAANWAKIAAVTEADDYVKYVLQKDWDCTYLSLGGNGEPRHGNNIIFDLNGYTLRFVKAVNVAFWGSGIKNLEFTDSSAAGTGTMRNQSAGIGTIGGNTTNAIIISGGTYYGNVNLLGKTLRITGGTFHQTLKNLNVLIGDIVLADYMVQTTDASGLQYIYPGANTTGESFAVSGSRSDLLSGEYNYEFTTITENLRAGDCLLEKMGSANYPSYLWYRSRQDEPYELLTAL